VQGILKLFITIFWVPSMLLFLGSLFWVNPINIDLNINFDKGRNIASKTNPTSFQESTKKPNIILVTFDSLSAHNMSVYGYERKTTPYWEKLARTSYIFENMHSNSNFTEVSSVSLLTSKYPWTHGIYRKGAIKKEFSEETLMNSLRAQGYTNIALFGPLSGIGINPYTLGVADQFDYIALAPSNKMAIMESLILKIQWMTLHVENTSIDQWLKSIYYSYQHSKWAKLLKNKKRRNLKEGVEENLNQALNILAKFKDQPVFLWVHCYPPHLPYWPPPKYRGIFLDSNEYLPIEENNTNIPFNKENWKDVLNKIEARYDEMVLYADTELGKFVEGLKARGLLKDSLLIISSDHGEIFSEQHMTQGHGTKQLYINETHIPLLIRLPNQKKGSRVTTLAEQVDLAPTILSLVGSLPPPWMEGESLVPYMNGEKQISLKPKFSMTLEGNRAGSPIKQGTMAVLKDNYRLSWSLPERIRLHHIINDPNEEINLVHQLPLVAQKLKNYILEKAPLQLITSDFSKHPDLDAHNALDQDASTFWQADSPYPHWLKIDLVNSPRAISHYIFKTTGNKDSYKKMPQQWQFQGSSDGITWATLDERKMQSHWKIIEKRKYNFNNNLSFRYYRFMFKKGNDPLVLRLAEVEI